MIAQARTRLGACLSNHHELFKSVIFVTDLKIAQFLSLGVNEVHEDYFDNVTLDICSKIRQLFRKTDSLCFAFCNHITNIDYINQILSSFSDQRSDQEVVVCRRGTIVPLLQTSFSPLPTQIYIISCSDRAWEEAGRWA